MKPVNTARLIAYSSAIIGFGFMGFCITGPYGDPKFMAIMAGLGLTYAAIIIEGMNYGLQ